MADLAKLVDELSALSVLEAAELSKMLLLRKMNSTLFWPLPARRKSKSSKSFVK